MSAPPSVRGCLVERGCAAAAARLFPESELVVLERSELRPETPFEGPLFRALEAIASFVPEAAGDDDGGPGDPGVSAPGSGAVVGLVVPGVWCGEGSSPSLMAVADHVNLTWRGPLTGRWPATVPRTFPCMTGIYQPTLVRSATAPSIYSVDVVVAGVGDAAELTPFERRVLDEGGCQALSDCLVPAAIVAAYYRVSLAAGIVPARHVTASEPQARTP